MPRLAQPVLLQLAEVLNHCLVAFLVLQVLEDLRLAFKACIDLFL